MLLHFVSTLQKVLGCVCEYIVGLIMQGHDFGLFGNMNRGLYLFHLTIHTNLLPMQTS